MLNIHSAMRYSICCLLLLWLAIGFSQINYTANDKIIPYKGNFRYGANMGYYYPWQDHQLAEIAAGEEQLGLPGVGVNSVRPALFEHFFDQWGYAARKEAFDRYGALGMTENVGFIGYPADRHRDKTIFCPEGGNVESAVFANLYEPIWDDGSDGTPVNDSNYYALYVYKVVHQYKGQVRFWEVWNEPDFDYASNAWKNPGDSGNWWDNIPAPCSYALKAPAYYYNRILRISYEVIKSIDPTLYVCTGGLGYPSFLDIILRYTDNPDGGKVTANYPLNGGAYFDVLSFHSYPHIDGSVRQWSNEIWDFEYQRHSDAAVAGFINRKRQFEEVLIKYGYDGKKFPAKEWICTETTVPRKQFTDNMGSELAQVNYIIKSLVEAQKEGLHQYHIYTMADSKKLSEASSEYDLMGLFYALENVQPYQHTPTVAGIAYKTISDFLYGWRYDVAQTARLNLPKTVNGAAFKNEGGEYRYVLWAVTMQDENELISTTYLLPKSLKIEALERREWDYSETGNLKEMVPQYIQLNGSPSFFRPIQRAEYVSIDLMPIFTKEGNNQIKLLLPNAGTVNLAVLDKEGKVIATLLENIPMTAGRHIIPLKDTFPGLNLIQLEVDGKKVVHKMIFPKK